MMKMLKVFAVMMSFALALSSCTGKTTSKKEATPTKKPVAEATVTPTVNPELAKLTKNKINATINLEDGGKIKIELYPDLAPESVENFINLANDGFYDGTIFHRVIEGFMIQGGGFDESLNQKHAETIYGEFEANGFKNDLKHERGVLSMARTPDPDSASSQFFIMHEDSPHLDGNYAAFGKVVDDESMEVVDEIASVKTGTVSSIGMSDVPATPIVIKSVIVGAGTGTSSDKAEEMSEAEDEAVASPEATDEEL